MFAESGCADNSERLSVVIPTYQRGATVLDTVEALLGMDRSPDEIIVVDQTTSHEPSVEERLGSLDGQSRIRWIRLPQPSIPVAMNVGLASARSEIVLFLDDDIVPGEQLVVAHIEAHRSALLVAGMVLQPGERPCSLASTSSFRFNSDSPAWISEFMGGNFSVRRDLALDMGGFDENFVGAAYRFEAEFAHRFISRRGPIRYEPRAVIRHLQVPTGGTRAKAHHLRTVRPEHSVGEYYYLLKCRPEGWWRRLLWRPIRAVRTRHHLRRPWWIPLTIVAEARGFLLAVRLLTRGPRLLRIGASDEGLGP